VPAVSPEQGGDTAIAIAAELFGKDDEGSGERLLCLPAVRLLALGRSMLTKRLAGPAL
jgi:hypothetical protein